ncbi:MAG: hypothetical protein J5766_03525 [Clostridia bacterium]|nr:hypothetical protein [Clostridia bacterium]
MPFAENQEIFGLHSTPANTTHALLKTALKKAVFAYKVFFRRTCRRKNKSTPITASEFTRWFIDRLKPAVSFHDRFFNM